MFGKKKRMIAEQEERIQALEKQLESLTADNKRLRDRIIDVERRERGIGRALNEATATADNMITDAQRKADAILETAQAECEEQRKKGESIIEDAYRNAREIVREAEAEGTQKREEMQRQIEQYSLLLSDYDAMVQEQLQMAQNGAKRFAELARSLHEAVPQLLSADGTPLPGLKTPDSSEKSDDAETPSYFKENAPDYSETPLSYAPSRESGSDEQLWTVDRIAKSDGGSAGSDVDAIIEEILAATEDDA
jgi:cell division septum initiation protein DivIVA